MHNSEKELKKASEDTERNGRAKKETRFEDDEDLDNSQIRNQVD